MSTKAVEISNLPHECFERYAEDQETFTKELVRTHGVSALAEIDSTDRTYLSEADSIQGIDQCHVPWSHTQRPAGTYRGGAFKNEIITNKDGPALDALNERLEEFSTSELQNEGYPTKTLEEIQNESEALKNCLHTATILTQDLVEGNAKRIQYQKG